MTTRLNKAISWLMAGPKDTDPYLGGCKSHRDAYMMGVNTTINWAYAIGEIMREEAAQMQTPRAVAMSDAALRNQIHRGVQDRCGALQADLVRADAENVRVVGQCMKLKAQGRLVRHLAGIIRRLREEHLGRMCAKFGPTLGREYHTTIMLTNVLRVRKEC